MIRTEIRGWVVRKSLVVDDYRIIIDTSYNPVNISIGEDVKVVLADHDDVLLEEINKLENKLAQYESVYGKLPSEVTL